MQLGIQQAFRTDPLLEIIGTEKTASDGLTAVETHKPDVVVLDIGLPDASGLKIVPQIHQHSQIVILTSHADAEKVKLALSVGARGYCVKGRPVENLKSAIKLVASGDLYLDCQIAGTLIQQLSQQKQQNPPPNPDLKLTVREVQVLKLISEGLQNNAIAEQLEISQHTVKHHVKEIMAKLQAKNRTELAVKSIRSGLVD